MAEVLSQSQIDALLNAARNGEMDLAAKAESSSEKKYRKYDFYSPRKFTKDRLKMLSGIFENYTRIINSRINGLLHTALLRIFQRVAGGGRVVPGRCRAGGAGTAG